MKPTAIRLLAVISSSEIGGAERVLATTLSKLDPGRFDVTVVCSRRGPMFAEYERHARRVWSLELKSPVDIRAIAALRSLMAHVKPDIVHTHLWSADMLGGFAGRLARVPALVSTVHGAYHLPTTRALRQHVLKLGHRAIYRWFDRVIAVSRYVRDQLVKGPGIRADPERITIIPNGLDLAGIARASEHSPDDRALAPDGPTVLNVANFFPGKGQEWLIRAMSQVVHACPRARCIFVGDGPERPSIEALATELGVRSRALFLGRIPDALHVVRDCDVFVVPSLSEGCPLTVLEALAFGRPVVASRAGGIPEMIEDGTTGVLVPPRDPAALARAIVTLLTDPQRSRRMGEAGRDVVRTRFSGDVMTRSTETLYEELVRAKGY